MMLLIGNVLTVLVMPADGGDGGADDYRVIMVKSIHLICHWYAYPRGEEA